MDRADCLFAEIAAINLLSFYIKLASARGQHEIPDVGECFSRTVNRSCVCGYRIFSLNLNFALTYKKRFPVYQDLVSGDVWLIVASTSLKEPSYSFFKSFLIVGSSVHLSYQEMIDIRIRKTINPKPLPKILSVA